MSEKPKSEPVKKEAAKDESVTESEKKPVAVDVKDEKKDEAVGKEGKAAKAEDAEDDNSKAATVPVIDMDTFSQILEMDDDDDHEFSKSLVENYFEQADATFVDMDNAFARKDLPKLSSLGHFLKGSSAALGISQVQTGCEAMQHYGAHKDGSSGRRLTSEEALALIEPLLAKIKVGHREAEKWLKDYYGMAKA